MRFTVLPVLLPTRFRLTPALAAAFGSDLAMLSAPWTGKAQPFGLPIEAQRPHGVLWPVSDEMPQPVVTAIAVLAASGVPCATNIEAFCSMLRASWFQVNRPQRACLVGQLFASRLAGIGSEADAAGSGFGALGPDAGFRLVVGRSLVGLMPRRAVDLPQLAHLLADMPKSDPFDFQEIATAVADWPEPVRQTARILPLLRLEATGDSAHAVLEANRAARRDIAAFLAQSATLDLSVADPVVLKVIGR